MESFALLYINCTSGERVKQQKTCLDLKELARPLLRQVIMKNILNKLTLASSMVILLAILPSTLTAYDEIVVKEGATIRGTVRVEGKLPKLPPLQITKYKEICKDVPNESLIVGPRQGLRYAVVTLEGITKGKPVERETINELDNVKCRFTPMCRRRAWANSCSSRTPILFCIQRMRHLPTNSRNSMSGFIPAGLFGNR